jgi:hypothetical protein
MQRRSTQHLLVVLCLFFTLAFPTSHASAAGTVGTGTPASCTSVALAAALSGGGTITFNCGSDAVTILVSETLQVSAAATTIDGGGKITLSGGGERRILRHRSLSSSSALTIRNMAFEMATQRVMPLLAHQMDRLSTVSSKALSQHSNQA